MLGCTKPEAVRPSPPPPRAPDALVKAVAKHLPPAVDFIAVADLRPLAGDVLDASAFGVLPPVADPAAFRADLGRVLRRHTGADLTGIDHIVAFGRFDGELAGAVVMGALNPDSKGDEVRFGRLKATRIEREIFAVPIAGGLLLGNEPTFAVLGKQKKRLAGAALKGHLTALDRMGPSIGALTVSLASKAARKLVATSELKDGQIGRITGGITTGLTIEIEAGRAGRQKIIAEFKTAKAHAREELADLKSEIESEDLVEAWGGVLAQHYGPVLLKAPRIGERDGRVVIDVAIPTTIDPRGAVAAAVILAGTTGLPELVKRSRRVHTEEARVHLDRIYSAASAYFSTPRVSPHDGSLLPCQFPRDQPLTPDVTGQRCCRGPLDRDRDERCDVAARLWNTPTWTSLKFAIGDQHRFGYAFASTGVGERARFTVTAHGDLDCDGILSTFERYGYGDSGCQVKGSSAMYIDRETE